MNNHYNIITKENSEKIDNILLQKLSWSKKELIYSREVYHYIHNKYWYLSITIIILSCVLTIVESTKLIFLESSDKLIISNNTSSDFNNKFTYSITKNELDWNLACDLFALFTGGLITLIMSLIRFNKYQIKMELISNRLMQISNYDIAIKVLKYKHENNLNKVNYDNNIHIELLKLEKIITPDSELMKILSENKERELRSYSEKIVTKGPEYNSFSKTLSKILCCINRINYQDDDTYKYNNTNKYNNDSILVKYFYKKPVNNNNNNEKEVKGDIVTKKEDVKIIDFDKNNIDNNIEINTYYNNTKSTDNNYA